MRCLIVIAHPLSESLCHALAQTAITALSDLGHDIQVLDLYQQGFAPALGALRNLVYLGFSGSLPFSGAGRAAIVERISTTRSMSAENLFSFDMGNFFLKSYPDRSGDLLLDQ